MDLSILIDLLNEAREDARKMHGAEAAAAIDIRFKNPDEGATYSIDNVVVKKSLGEVRDGDTCEIWLEHS